MNIPVERVDVLRREGKSWRQCANLIWSETGRRFQPNSLCKAVRLARADALEAMSEQAAAMRGTS